MFGFLNAPRVCCSKEQHVIYRRYFCGLCNRLRKDYGLLARFLINRDSTFLSLLTAAQSKVEPAARRGTCCNPLGRARTLYQEGRHASYAAAVTLSGFRAKLDDDINDDSPSAAWGKRLLRLAATPLHRESGRRLAQWRFPSRPVVQALGRQEGLEKRALVKGQCDLHQLAEPTEFAFASIFEHTAVLADSPGNGPQLRQGGRSLGRIVYWMDAAQDLAADRRRQRFNPFLVEPGLAAKLPNLVQEELQRLTAAARRLRFHRHGALVRGILIDGVRSKCAQTLGDDSSEAASPEEPGAVTAPTAKGTMSTKKRKKRMGNGCCSDCCGCCMCPCDDAACCECGCCCD